MIGSFMRFSTSNAFASVSTMVMRNELGEVELVLSGSTGDGDGGDDSDPSVSSVGSTVVRAGLSTVLVNSLGTGAGSCEVGTDDDDDEDDDDALKGATMVLFSSHSFADSVIVGGSRLDIALLLMFSSIRTCVSDLVIVENNRHKKPSFRCGCNIGENDFRNRDPTVPGTIIALRTIIIGRIHADICGSSTAATNTTKFNRARMIATVLYAFRGKYSANAFCVDQ